MGTTWKQAFHALQCPWPLAPIHTCSWESNKTIVAISEVIILWYSLVQWSPLSQHSPEVSKCVMYIRSVKDTPSFIEMLIPLVPFHLRFCALFNGFSTEPFPSPLLLQLLVPGNHSPAGLPHQQSPDSGRLPADRGLVWVSTITAWKWVLASQNGSVCILNQTEVAVYGCTQACIRYSCLLWPLRPLEVVGAWFLCHDIN